MSIFLTLTVVIFALICFVGEWLPTDIVAIIVSVLLTLLGLITPEESISGFSNSATITVLAMFILSAGISRTGAIQTLEHFLLKWGGKHPTKQIFILGLLAGPITALVNNTAVVAVFLPIVENWCSRQRIPVSLLLLPLSYVTILGGMITIVGTSTSVLASGLSDSLGYGSFGLFQFTFLGLITFSIGLIYLAIVAPQLLKNKVNQCSHDDLVTCGYALKDYISEIIITPGSQLVGQTLNSSRLQRQFDVDVIEIIDNGVHFSQPLGDKKLRVGCILLVRGGREDLLQIKNQKGIEILADVKFNYPSLKADFNSEEEGVAEVLITSNSNLIGSTLKELRFRQRYNVTVLAIRRGQELSRNRLGKTPLRFGDVLLVSGPQQSLIGLQTSRNLLVVMQRDIETLRHSKAGTAIAICLTVVLLAAFKLLTILVSSLIGVILMVLTGCLKPKEIYEAVRWDIIFLLAGLIPLGIAMSNSGTTQLLAENIIKLAGQLPGYWLLTFFFVITACMTEILSNNAAVILLLPIAAKVAESLSFNPLAFMLAVTFAASYSFMTPIGYQTNTMVYSPGGYRFLDFFRVGAPLTIIMTLIIPPLIIILYGI
ncbi:MAG: SLC13 family permease [Sphaerospermopsis sp. SIO1G2]|nr:SLC13 family permease [Sphaerospermopsis sp. SIO1G1]NET73796.1 SLC13 family permease [Sphaerospermopsis sp. SIO1G2]